tara:strand:+ start:35 stop:469 length:435 start_codon:yes stop_codon:yes gene_type:complete
MLEFEYSNDFDRFINITIFIYGINLINNNNYIKMNTKISIEDIKKHENNNFDIFREKIENEVKKFIVQNLKETSKNIIQISKDNNILLKNIVQVLFINNKIENIHIEWSSSSLKEFLYVPNKHYLLYFEDDLLLKTKKINFNYM